METQDENQPQHTKLLLQAEKIQQAFRKHAEQKVLLMGGVFWRVCFLLGDHDWQLIAVNV